MGKKKYLLTDEVLKKEMRRLKRAERRRRTLRGTIIIAIAALAIAALLADQKLMLVTVRGNSMNDTLESGSVVLCVLGAPPQRGKLTLFSYENALLIKRVIGLEGDEVIVDDEGVSVNGERLREDYATGSDTRLSDISYPVIVPEGNMFVMGDYRGLSVDSRSSTFGTVAVDSAVARPWFVIWPLFRAANLNG